MLPMVNSRLRMIASKGNPGIGGGGEVFRTVMLIEVVAEFPATSVTVIAML